MSVDSEGEPYKYSFSVAMAMVDMIQVMPPAERDHVFGHIVQQGESVVLKPQQLAAIKAARNGDCFVVLPCGFGKTKIAEEAPPDGNIAIISSPLNSIITEQKVRYVLYYFS